MWLQDTIQLSFLPLCNEDPVFSSFQWDVPHFFYSAHQQYLNKHVEQVNPHTSTNNLLTMIYVFSNIVEVFSTVILYFILSPL